MTTEDELTRLQQSCADLGAELAKRDAELERMRVTFADAERSYFDKNVELRTEVQRLTGALRNLEAFVVADKYAARENIIAMIVQALSPAPPTATPPVSPTCACGHDFYMHGGDIPAKRLIGFPCCSTGCNCRGFTAPPAATPAPGPDREIAEYMEGGKRGMYKDAAPSDAAPAGPVTPPAGLAAALRRCDPVYDGECVLCGMGMPDRFAQKPEEHAADCPWRIAHEPEVVAGTTWRVGRKVGRTIYRDNQLVGVMDHPMIARLVVDAVNLSLHRAKQAAGTDATGAKEGGR